MLKKLLNQTQCGACRLCCVFDKTDLWEAPIITKKLDTYTYCATEYGDIFQMSWNNEGLATCPALSSTGCTLGSDKPFDCKIWPFRVMKSGENLYLTLSPQCKPMLQNSLSDILAFVNGGFGETVFEEAMNNKAAIKPYIDGYTILEVRGSSAKL